MRSTAFTRDVQKQVSACMRDACRHVQSIPNRWKGWWLRETPAYSLALFRIVFALFLLILWSVRFINLDVLFSDRGFGFSIVDRDIPDVLLLLVQSPTVPQAAILALAMTAAILALLFGIQTRVAAAVTLTLSAYFFIVGAHLLDSTAEKIIFFILLVLTFSGAGETLSFDAWRKYDSIFRSAQIVILPIRLICIQITAMYLASGFVKLQVADWQDGMMLYHSFQSILATPLALAFVRTVKVKLAYDLLVFFVKLLELLLPIGLWMPRIQWFFFFAGALLHIAIALFLGLWWFLFIPFIYPLFIPPERFSSLFRRLE